MTTPESPRTKWPLRPIRLDDVTWKQIRVKLLEDDENWQRVTEKLVRDWLAGKIIIDRSK